METPNQTQFPLSPLELATILGALRYLQAKPSDVLYHPGIAEILTSPEVFDEGGNSGYGDLMLDDSELDALCERLNTSGLVLPESIDVLITVEGGCVTGGRSSLPNVFIGVRDFDAIENGDHDPDEFAKLQDADGRISEANWAKVGLPHEIGHQRFEVEF